MDTKKDAYTGLHARCVDQLYSSASLTEQKVYEIICQTGEQNEYFVIVDDNGIKGAYYKERFVLTNELVTK